MGRLMHITYVQCKFRPWTMCRHKSANRTADSMAHWMSLIPIGMRQYIRHVIALPAARQPNVVLSYNSFESIKIDDRATLHDFVAEAAIGLGRYTMQDGNGYWST
jgi:hypothetical protein